MCIKPSQFEAALDLQHAVLDNIEIVGKHLELRVVAVHHLRIRHIRLLQQVRPQSVREGVVIMMWGHNEGENNTGGSRP